jgi:hypothetical protein
VGWGGACGFAGKETMLRRRRMTRGREGVGPGCRLGSSDQIAIEQLITVHGLQF